MWKQIHRIVLLIAAIALFTPTAFGELPRHVNTRKSAPSRTFVPEALRVEAADLDRVMAKTDDPTPPSQDVDNVYWLPSADGAARRTSSGVKGENPISVSEATFRKHADTVVTASKPRPSDDHVTVNVYQDRGIVEIRFSDRTELIQYERAPDAPEDAAGLHNAIDFSHEQFFKSADRPEGIRHDADGTFFVKVGGVWVKVRQDLVRAPDAKSRPVRIAVHKVNGNQGKKSATN